MSEIMSYLAVELFSFQQPNNLRTTLLQSCFLYACVVELRAFFSSFMLEPMIEVVCTCVGIQYINNVLVFFVSSNIWVGSSTTWSGTNICSDPQRFATIRCETEC